MVTQGRERVLNTGPSDFMKQSREEVTSYFKAYIDVQLERIDFYLAFKYMIEVVNVPLQHING